MKKIKIIAIALAIILSSSRAYGQLPSLDFVYGFTNDARLLLEEYMRPYANIMGANLNAGWYNTAEPHKLLGFDITATFSIAYAPATALSYDLSKLAGLRADIEGSTNFAPTVAGNMETRPSLVYKTIVYNPETGVNESFVLADVPHPNGTGLNFLPMPMVQATVGLIKGTDITIRYVPEINLLDRGRIGVYGIGAKHSVSQWIPVVKRLKFINIAVQGGYTKVSTSANLKMEPIAEIQPTNPPAWDDQTLDMDISGWTLNIIASQSIPFITVYEGIGYSNSLVELALLGDFPINDIVTTEEDFGKTTYRIVTDPIRDLSFENFRNLRLNAGVRLKLGFITLHYDFTRTLYSTHTAGVGITFR
ncbi:MAG: DUF6588 family protein [Bacteroidales bacterium]